MIMVCQRKAAKARHEKKQKQQQKQGGTGWLITAIIIMLCAESLVNWILGAV